MCASKAVSRGSTEQNSGQKKKNL